MRTKKLILVVVVFLTSTAFAQVSQVRFELPIHSSQNEAYKTISLRNDGLLLYGLFFAKDKNAIELIRVDTAFNQVWKGYIATEKSLYIVSSRFFSGQVYLLLKDRFNPLAEFIVLSIDVQTGNYGVRNVKTLLAFQPTHFVVTKSAVLIGGSFNYRPLVLYHGFSTNSSKILPGFFNEVGELNQIKADDEGNIDIVVSGRNLSRRRSLWIRNYDPSGDLVKTIFLLPQDDNINLIYGRSIPQPNGEQIVCGVYGRFTEYSRGIFVAKVNAYGEYAIKYYNYADLQRFFNYMKAKREKRVKERIERRKIRGKKSKFNYRLMIDDVLPYGDQVVMLGEAFYPHYTYPSAARGIGSPYYGGIFQRNQLSQGYRGELVFDGYQYTHAVVIGFDKEGNLKWDNSFEINDVRTMELEQFVKIHPDPNRISLLYLFDNVIRSKVIKDYDVVEGKAYDPLHTGDAEVVTRERGVQQTKLDYWYDDVFYATGIQNVRSRRDPNPDHSRRVFFINKIEYK